MYLAVIVEQNFDNAACVSFWDLVGGWVKIKLKREESYMKILQFTNLFRVRSNTLNYYYYYYYYYY
jgi:hypothetical protein